MHGPQLGPRFFVGEAGDRVVGHRQLDRCAEFVLEAVRGYLELHWANGCQHRCLVADVFVAQHLHHALFVELVDAISELLEAAGVFGAGDGEVLRSERRDGRVANLIVLPEGVANAYLVCVDQTNNVARPGFVERFAVGAECGVGVFRGQRLAAVVVGDDHAAFELAAAHTEERRAVAMCLVHVGLHLEHKAGERRIERPRRVFVVALLWLG